MKAKYAISNQLVFEVEEKNSKEVFRSIAEIQDAFEADKSCGLCDGPIQFRVRTVDKNEFFELVCRVCGGTLALGQTKDGERIYPKRKGDPKKRGWEAAYNEARAAR